jgi:hypothetical protein
MSTHMSTTTDTSVRELDRRISDGFDVRLVWNSLTNCLFVSIEDQRHGATYEFSVDASEAMDAFRHPFAYRRDAGARRAGAPCR